MKTTKKSGRRRGREREREREANEKRISRYKNCRLHFFFFLKASPAGVGQRLRFGRNYPDCNAAVPSMPRGTAANFLPGFYGIGGKSSAKRKKKIKFLFREKIGKNQK